MLTGDNAHTARAVARHVGIDEVHGDLLPDDKLRLVRELGRRGPVAMVGDGINDAPALATAALGVAMGAAGSDTAIETADVALMDDDPRKIAELVHISRHTTHVLWQNIVVAIAVKARVLRPHVRRRRVAVARRARRHGRQPRRHRQRPAPAAAPVVRRTTRARAR